MARREAGKGTEALLRAETEKRQTAEQAVARYRAGEAQPDPEGVGPTADLGQELAAARERAEKAEKTLAELKDEIAKEREEHEAVAQAELEGAASEQSPKPGQEQAVAVPAGGDTGAQNSESEGGPAVQQAAATQALVSQEQPERAGKDTSAGRDKEIEDLKGKPDMVRGKPLDAGHSRLKRHLIGGVGLVGAAVTLWWVQHWLGRFDFLEHDYWSYWSNAKNIGSPPLGLALSFPAAVLVWRFFYMVVAGETLLTWQLVFWGLLALTAAITAWWIG